MFIKICPLVLILVGFNDSSYIRFDSKRRKSHSLVTLLHYTTLVIYITYPVIVSSVKVKVPWQKVPSKEFLRKSALEKNLRLNSFLRKKFPGICQAFTPGNYFPRKLFRHWTISRELFPGIFLRKLFESPLSKYLFQRELIRKFPILHVLSLPILIGSQCPCGKGPPWAECGRREGSMSPGWKVPLRRRLPPIEPGTSSSMWWVKGSFPSRSRSRLVLPLPLQLITSVERIRRAHACPLMVTPMMSNYTDECLGI
jgi:hypothetical protein